MFTSIFKLDRAPTQADAFQTALRQVAPTELDVLAGYWRAHACQGDREAAGMVRLIDVEKCRRRLMSVLTISY